MPCKVLSFDEIHRTKDFFKDCNECVNINYRKQLEQVQENNLYQQLKVDQMYWKKRAEEEGTQELVDMYNRFNKMLAAQKEETRVNNSSTQASFDLNQLNTPYNYEISESGKSRRSISNSEVNRTLNSAENLIKKVGIDLIDGPLPTTNMSSANINGILNSAESLISRARPTLNMNELKSSIAASLERRSRGSRSVRQVHPLANYQYLMKETNVNAVSKIDDFREQVIRNLPTSPTANISVAIEQPISGSGLRKKSKKKVVKKTKKSNLLM